MLEHEWPCVGAVNIDEERLLILWESEWYSLAEYDSLRADGHKGWLEYAGPQNQLLVAWEPTIETKSAQFHPGALLVHFSIEVERHRRGLLGYVAAKYLDSPASQPCKRLAFLACWKTAPMPKGQFAHLQKVYPSHRGFIIHSEQEKDWIQWEPTWVYYERLDRKKQDILYRLRSDPEALLAQFHRIIIHHSTLLPVKKRLSRA
jgi:hypothetical protein